MAIRSIVTDRSPVQIYRVTRATNDHRYFDGTSGTRDTDISSYGSGNGQNNPAASRAYDFWDSLGINTHIIYTDSDYWQASSVKTCLDYLGIKYLRDQWRDPSNSQGLATYATLATAGYKFNMLIKRSQTDFSTAISDLTDWIALHEGAVVSVEGPNEINNAPVTYGGETGETGGNLFMADFYDAVQADSVLGTDGLDVPIYDLTGSFTANDCTHANIHCYPPNGAHPTYKFLQIQTSHASAKPFVITEAGWFTAPNLTNGVDEATQARLTLNALFAAYLLGFKRIFLYQLLDAYTDADGSNQEKHFGLFRKGYGAKPAADAIHNLNAILADTDDTSASFTTTSLTYSVVNMPAEGRWLLLQKASGTYYLILWLERSVWDSSNKIALASAVNGPAVTVQFGSQFTTLNRYDPVSSSDAVETLTSAKVWSGTVADKPVILEVA